MRQKCIDKGKNPTNRINTRKQPSKANCAEQSKSSNHIGRNKDLAKTQCETNPSEGGGNLIQIDDSWQYLREGGQSHHQRPEPRAIQGCYS